MIAGAEQEGLSTEVGTDDRACIRDRLADVDVASMVDVSVSESTDPVMLNLLGCVPELFIEFHSGRRRSGAGGVDRPAAVLSW